jgi:hypothetical protein
VVATQRSRRAGGNCAHSLRPFLLQLFVSALLVRQALSKRGIQVAAHLRRFTTAGLDVESWDPVRRRQQQRGTERKRCNRWKHLDHPSVGGSSAPIRPIRRRIAPADPSR